MLLITLHNCAVDVVQVLLWDTAASNSPVQAIEKAHGSCDVHTVDWSGLQEHLIVTGEHATLMGCSY
jgi:hypothetical protein